MSRSGRFSLFVVLCAGFFHADAPAAHSDEKRELGWLENVRVLPEDMTLVAKLDTGANTTSLGTRRLTRFERGGRPWVRFALSDKKGKEFEFERPIIRVVRVKRSEARTRTRPVVMLTLCIAGRFSEETVILTTRSHLLYPMLIGRATMAGHFLVNPSRKYTRRAKCIGR